MKEKLFRLSGPLALGLILVLAVVWGVAQLAPEAEAPVARSYSTACYREQGGDKWVCGDGGEMEFRSGSTLEIQSGATTSLNSGTFTGTVSAEQLTSSDDADIADDVRVDGTVSVTETVKAEHLRSTDDADVNDALTANSATVTNTVQAEQLTSTDDMDVADDVRIDGALAVTSTASVNSYLYHRTEVITKSASYTLTAAESGSLFSNHNASGEITFTLPAAAEGLSYCIYVHEAYTVNLDAASGDQTHHLTDSAGDRVQNSGTAGDSVCVLAMNGTYWVPTNEEGTWADAN